MVAGDAELERYWVTIESRISVDTLDVHCQGGIPYEDLGLNHIPGNGSYRFTFISPSFLGIQYDCSLTWPNHGHIQFMAFVNNQTFVSNNCDERQCLWKATEDGIYFYNVQTKKYMLSGTWSNLSYL